MMQEHIQAREEIINYLQRDQFGPYGERNEVLPENPLRRYMVGVLHPRGMTFEEAEDDGGHAREPVTREDDSETGLRMSNTIAPSSYGMTFACKRDVERIKIIVSYARYRPLNPEESTENENTGKKNNQEKWRRQESTTEFKVKINTPGDKRLEVITGDLSFRLRCRKEDQTGSRSITVSLVNEQKCSRDAKLKTKAEKSFFQVHFGVKGIDDEAVFVSRNDFGLDSAVSEENSIRLLYRDVPTYATGHGCATEWSDNPQENGCTWISSTFVPCHTVYPMVQPEDLGLPKFSIMEIADSKDLELATLFSEIPEKYDAWIDGKELIIAELNEMLRPQAKEHIRLCREASKRIRRGIRLIERDDKIRYAFQLMHKAMLHQISRSVWFKEGTPNGGPEPSPEYSWYPFQMAFILECIESLADPNCRERELVDLLWFPTGGGKTEAYLGIIAFSIFLRRLRSLDGLGESSGTVALMRYTLRLLTVDQFYRAALLVCSCEKIRKEEMHGLNTTTPISIGLWVGGEASPNTWKKAKEELERINSGGDEPKTGNPIKLKSCPWCRGELGSADYTVPDEHTPMLIRCPSDECDFHDGLPVWVTDTDVYNQRPSLIIGTVDKFARIPWVKEAGLIFGSDDKSLPPEVIIQDELHLISGPLGTMVGLYEAAVDGLCGAISGPPPKVIASTATIRNAEQQVLNIFCRGVSQFPPPCLEYGDSFFARENRSLPGRKYTGVFTPGTSPTTALVRTFAILLHGAKKLACDDAVKDAYWTLMAYFNSLRELGGASIQVEDDVNDYLKMCAERDEDSLRLRQVHYKAELTGRVDSNELEEIRENLWCRYPDEDCPDVVLATNMISVGLDVPRLGMMSIVGQPKSTAEYIQATSRIGRQYPGLVVTIYNWTRSRDRSHFERFKGYHSKLYSEVEATSVTPFSSRARDRGLHAVLISMVRHLISGMDNNRSAAHFEKDAPQLKRLVDFIVKRVNRIDSDEAAATENDIIEIINRWGLLADGNELVYAKSKGSFTDQIPLMVAAEDASKTSRSFPTLNSLRNIDPAAGLSLEN